MTRMSREEREELYDPGWNRGRTNTLWNRVRGYKRDSPVSGHREIESIRSHDRRTYDQGKQICKELARQLKACMAKKAYDPKRKGKSKGTWLDFVKSHKYIKNKKGQLDLKAISRLWRARH